MKSISGAQTAALLEAGIARAGAHLTNLKLAATRLAGRVTRDASKPEHWGSARVVALRQEVYDTMLVQPRASLSLSLHLH